MKATRFLILLLVPLLGLSQTTTNLGEGSSDQGNANVSLGYHTGNIGGYTTSVGANAGENNSANYNTFVGNSSGRLNTTGHRNVFVGQKSGYNNVSGVFNTFVGDASGAANTTGDANTFIGRGSGRNNTSGEYNTYLGVYSGENSATANDNTAIGHSAGRNLSTGYRNTLMGKQSGVSNNGNNNIFIGYRAGNENLSGSGNIFIGTQSGFNELGSNKLYIENSSDDVPLIYGDFTNGVLGINTKEIPSGYAFAVNGKTITEEIKVQLVSTWPDYVFESDYNLPSLSEVYRFIQNNGHLEDIPSAIEVQKEGILVGEMNAKLLKKIEELTLYLIQQQEIINAQNKMLEDFGKRIKKLENHD